MGMKRAVHALLKPRGRGRLLGPAPALEDNQPLTPADQWGHDHLWWFDRMARTANPLQERMTLVWHDWFATSNDGVGDQGLMLDQNKLFRRHAIAVRSKNCCSTSRTIPPCWSGFPATRTPRRRPTRTTPAS